MNIKLPGVKPSYVAFGGGLDTSTQRMLVKPGMAQAAKNYEPTLQGGYRRIGGYERFDGRARPSDATYEVITGSLPFTAAAGQAILGATSGATGVICYVASDLTWLAVTKRNANAFQVNEPLSIAGLPAGTFQGDAAQFDAFTHNAVAAAAAAAYRPDIGAPPGSGPTRILAINGNVFAMRNTAPGTAAALHKATSAGWVPVALNREVSFTAGQIEPAEGAVISKGGVTATVLRVVQEGGDWTANTARGRIIISATAGGEFSAGPITGGGTLNLSGASTAITLLPNGQLNFDEGSFVNGQYRAYACDGVNREFEFDGSVLAPITTPLRASRVCVHADRLILACGSELVISSVGDAYQFDAATGGAATIGAGAPITNLMPMTGSADTKALLVTTTKGVLILYGSSSDDFLLVPMGVEGGVAADTAQPIGGGLIADVSGVRRMDAVQSWGNFSYGLATRRLGGYMAKRTPICSVAVSSETLYRLWFSDGAGLSGAPFGNEIQWMPIGYDRTVRQMISTIINGIERIFFASDDGMVYEADVGRSFDGAAIEAWLMLQPFSDGNPAVNKTWRGALLEARGESAFSIQAQAEFDDGDPDVSQGDVIDASSGPVGMRWDVGNWDSGVYDGGGIASLRISCEGEAASAAMAIYSNSSNELRNTLSGCSFLLTARRIK